MDVSDIAEQYANGSRDRWPVGCAGRAITVQPQLYLGSRENFMGVKSADGNVAGEGHGLRVRSTRKMRSTVRSHGSTST
jgi:hypothetical protein